MLKCCGLSTFSAIKRIYHMLSPVYTCTYQLHSVHPDHSANAIHAGVCWLMTTCPSVVEIISTTVKLRFAVAGGISDAVYRSLCLYGCLSVAVAVCSPFYAYVSGCVYVCVWTWAVVIPMSGLHPGLHGCQAISSSVKICFCGSMNSLFHFIADFHFHSFCHQLSPSANLCFWWWVPTVDTLPLVLWKAPSTATTWHLYSAYINILYPTLPLWTSNSGQL